MPTRARLRIERRPGQIVQSRRRKTAAAASPEAARRKTTRRETACPARPPRPAPSGAAAGPWTAIGIDTMQVEMQRPMARRQRLRRSSASRPTTRPPSPGAAAAGARLSTAAFARRHAAHDRNAEQRARTPKQRGDRKVAAEHVADRPPADVERQQRQTPGPRNSRRPRRRRPASGSPAYRRRSPARRRRRRPPAARRRPAMAAPAPQPTMVRRSARRRWRRRPSEAARPLAGLGIGGLQPDRGADAVGDQWSAAPRSRCRETTCVRHTARWPRSDRPRAPAGTRRQQQESHPSKSPPMVGTSRARQGSILDLDRKAFANGEVEQKRGALATATLIATTTTPPIIPISAASITRLFRGRERMPAAVRRLEIAGSGRHFGVLCGGQSRPVHLAVFAAR